jgi:hypothetical protein
MDPEFQNALLGSQLGKEKSKEYLWATAVQYIRPRKII